MIKVLLYLITFTFITGCFSEESASSGGGLFVGHKEVPNALSISKPSNAMYNESDVLSFSATHPYVMTVTGTPRIALDIGGATVYANYITGSGTKTINFQYTILAGDNDANGISFSGLELNGGTLTYTKGDVELTLPTVSTAGIYVSTTPAVEISNPINLSVVNIANDTTTYSVNGTCNQTGQAVSLTVNSVAVSGVSGLLCDGFNFTGSFDISAEPDGALALEANLLGATSTVINITKDTIAPSVAITSSPDINLSNNANYSISGTCDEAASTVNIDIGGLTNSAICDGSIWSVSNWDVSSLSDGTGVPVAVNYNDAALNPASDSTTIAKTSASHTIALDAQAAINIANQAAYTVSGTCSNNSENVTLDIGAGTVTDSVVCSTGTFSFSVNASTILDNASVAIQVDHGSATDTTNVLKDTTLPTLDTNSITASTYSLGQTISIAVDFSENVLVIGSPRIELSFESQSSSPLYANLASGNGTSTLVFDYTIASGDNDSNGINIANSIDLNGASIRDGAQNDAATTLITTSFPSVLVDSAAPYITSFVEPADGTYADGGGELLFQVNFSENITVTGTPQISVNLDGSTVFATYNSGSGTSGLEFSYAIQAGDTDTDGVVLNSTSIQLSGGSINATSDSDPSALEFGTYLNSMAAVLVDTSGTITAPNQVTGVTTAPTTSNSELSVAWSTPNDNGTSIIDYNVQYREQGQSTWNNVNPNPTSNSTSVSGLSSGVTYEIRVAANNGLLGAYSAISTAEIFDILSLNPVAWLSSTNITNGGSEPLNNDLIDQWEDLTGAASAATETNPANQPIYQTNVHNGLPAVRFNNLDRGLQGTFSRSVGTDLTFIVVGQFDTGSNDKCLFEFAGPGNARGFFIDRRYASNNNFSPASTKGTFALWRIEDAGGSAVVTENSSTQIFSGGTNFNTDFTGTGNYVLGDDITGGNRMNGFIGEFLIFDRALTPGEISTLETYLLNKWGL